MATLKFILRKSSRGDSHSSKICARLIHARQVRLITLAVELYPNEWDERRQKVVINEEGGTRLYRRLSRAEQTLAEYREQFEEVVERLEKQGRYSVNELIVGAVSRRGLLGLQGYTLHLTRLLEKMGQERTARAYLTTCRMLITFNKGNDIPLKHINLRLVKEFESYLKARGKAMNTISYYIRMLRAIYRKAVKDKLIDPKRENPFEESFTGFQRTTKRALNLDQIRRLNGLYISKLLEENGSPQAEKLNDSKFVDKELYTCWRYFFFCFHARGMSFVDLAYLRKENLRNGVISYYRKKTGQKIEVTLTETLKQIASSFADEVTGSPFVFPIISDPRKAERLQYETGLTLQNKRLKRLAKLANIDPSFGLSTHVSRHSWATVGKMQNLPLSVISEGLGHSSEKMTYTYLASFDRSILDQASAQIDLAISTPPENLNALDTVERCGGF